MTAATILFISGQNIYRIAVVKQDAAAKFRNNFGAILSAYSHCTLVKLVQEKLDGHCF